MKRVDLKIRVSRQDPDLLSIVGLDGHVTSIKKSLVRQGFKVGDSAVIVDAKELAALEEKAWMYDSVSK